MIDTIYKYRQMITNQPPLSQGDILCNLPYFTYDYLLRSSPRAFEKFHNEKDEIFSEILKKGGYIHVEGFIDSHWGILASQDCDIRPNKDLIFFPLEPTKSLDDESDIIKAVGYKITNTTRRLYLPKINPPESNSSYGPFEILYQNPFIVPYDLIITNLNNCWKARIIEEARKVFIGKLSHFYSRTPIEEIIFFENKEITKYLTKNWEAIWDKKKNREEIEQLFQERVKKIKQVREVLTLIKREHDLEKIFYYDTELITKIKKISELVPWFENANEINKKCKKIESTIKESPDVANSEFKDVIHDFIVKKNSFLDKWTMFWSINASNIRKIRREDIKITGIFPVEIIKTEGEYRDFANKAYKTNEILDEFPIILKKYSELWSS